MKTHIPLSSDDPTEKELETSIDSITPSKGPLNFTKVAGEVSKIMNSSQARKDAKKVAVVMYDQSPEQEEEQQIQEATKRLQEEEILLVTVPFVRKNTSDQIPKDEKTCITKTADHCVNPGPVSNTPTGTEPTAPSDPEKEAEKIVDVFTKGRYIYFY